MNVQFSNFAGRYDDLRQILTDSVCHHPERIAYIELPPNAEPIKLNYRDLLHRINALGAALEHPCFAEKKEDFNPAEMPNLDKRRLAILGDNSIDWIIAQMQLCLAQVWPYHWINSSAEWKCHGFWNGPDVAKFL